MTSSHPKTQAYALFFKIKIRSFSLKPLDLDLLLLNFSYVDFDLDFDCVIDPLTLVHFPGLNFLLIWL
jgi:hypothetical protein